MSDTMVLDATCTADGKVKLGTLEVVDAVKLGLGTKASTGVLVLDKLLAVYLTSNASDIKDLIEKLVTIVEKLVTISTGLDAASNSPGGQTANITSLTTLKTELNAMKDTLK